MGYESKDWQVWLDEYNTIDLSDTTIGGYSADTIVIDGYDFYSDWTNNIGRNNIVLTGAGEEMLRVAEDGFYVRGEKVPADKKEAKAVYEAFKRWMTWAIMNGEQ